MYTVEPLNKGPTNLSLVESSSLSRRVPYRRFNCTHDILVSVNRECLGVAFVLASIPNIATLATLTPVYGIHVSEEPAVPFD